MAKDYNQNRVFSKRTLSEMVVFVLLATIYLGVYQADYLFNMNMTSYFTTEEFYLNRFINHGGLVSVAGRFLSQFFFYPFVSSLCMVVVMCGVSFLFGKAYRIEGKHSSLTFLPMVLSIITIVSVGSSFCNKTGEQIVSPSLGLMLEITVASVIVMFIDNKKTSFFTPLLVMLLAYMSPIYGVMSMLLFFAGLSKEQIFRNLIPLAVSFISVTILMFHWAFNHFNVFAPMIPTSFVGTFTLTMITAVSPILIVLIVKYASNIISDFKYISIAVRATVLFVFALGIIFAAENKESFRAQCKMQRQLINYDYKGMLETSDKLDKASLPVIAYRIIALSQVPNMEDKFFDFTPKREQTEPIAQPYLSSLFFYAGQYNEGLMWAMNFSMVKEMCYLSMLNMAECYFANGEVSMAVRMLDMLSGKVGFGEIADKMKKVAKKGSQEFVKKYPMYLNTQNGVFERNYIFSIRNFEELYDEPTYYSKINMQRRLLKDLFVHDIKRFVEDLKISNIDPQSLPTCIQEGVYISSVIEGYDICNLYPISDKVAVRGNKILEMVKAEASEDEVIEKFGRSYFTHYFFSPRINRKNLND